MAVVNEASQVELLGSQDLRHRFTTDVHYAGFSRDGGRLATCVWQSPRFQTAVFDAQGHSLPETDRGQFVWFPPALAKRGALVWYDYQSTPTGNSA